MKHAVSDDHDESTRLISHRSAMHYITSCCYRYGCNFFGRFFCNSSDFCFLEFDPSDMGFVPNVSTLYLASFLAELNLLPKKTGHMT